MDKKQTVEVIDKEGTVIGTAQTTEITITNEAANDLIAFADAVKNGTAAPKMNAAVQYWEPSKKGEQSVGIFTGFAVIEKNEDGAKKNIPVATWYAQDESGAICRYMQGGVVTLDAFKIVPIKSKFVITFLEKVGRTKKFSVQVY